jgi:hypothetical protein
MAFFIFFLPPGSDSRTQLDPQNQYSIITLKRFEGEWGKCCIFADDSMGGEDWAEKEG